jgi:hypothetical protein
VGGRLATSPPPTDPSRLDEQARQALARWADAVAGHGDGPHLVPVDDGLGLVGAWEPEVGSNNKVAMLSGMIEAAPGLLPAGDPGSGEVRWDDGQTVTLPLMSAEAALQALTEVHRGNCGGCQNIIPLRVTGARLVTVTVRTDAVRPPFRHTSISWPAPRRGSRRWRSRRRRRSQ